MYDPLGNSPFAEDNVVTPPWPTTPHPPNSPIPNLKRASSHSQLQTPEKAPVSPVGSMGTGPYGREPQIYGQPESGLISPASHLGTNGAKYEKTEPYLRARITMLDRNRRDILVRFDAQTNLPNFTGSTYRNISRSYAEFQQFYDSIIHSNPQTIVPALPLAQTSAPTDEEDDRLVRIMLQRWLTRVCEDRFLMRDEETRSFIESDFGYQPTPRNPRKKAGSGFSLLKRGVPDEDETLQRARFELTKLEGHFFDSAKAIDKLSRVRKTLAISQSEMGNKLVNVASTEAHPPLANALRKLGRTWHSISDLDQAAAISECVIMGDTLGYQGMNARSAKETLSQRTSVLEEYQAAVKSSISKRRYIERLKASSSISASKVDEALEDLEEADKYEKILALRVDGISHNLHLALDRHNKLVDEDITTALIEHARSMISYEKQRLRELEALRPDFKNADKKFIPAQTGPPRPAFIPKLDDDLKPPVRPASAAPQPSISRAPPPLQAQAPVPPSKMMNGPLPTQPLPPQSPGAGPSSSVSSPTIPGANGGPPLSPSSQTYVPTAPRSNVAARDPLLGGRFDGTRSMFITPSAVLSSAPSPFPSFPQSRPASAAANTGPSASGDPLSASSRAPLTNGPLPPPPAPVSTPLSPSATSTHASASTPGGPLASSSQTPSTPIGPKPSISSASPSVPPATPLTPGLPASSSSTPAPVPALTSTSTANPSVSTPGKAPGVYHEVDPLGPLGPTAQLRRSTVSSTSSSVVSSPLGPGPLSSAGPSSPSPLANGNYSQQQQGVDPLGLAKPQYMSQSMRLPSQPQRPRLDAREAASKLANFF